MVCAGNAERRFNSSEPLTIKRDDFGPREAGISRDIARYCGEVELRHDMLDRAANEIMRRWAHGEIVMDPACPCTDALDCEVCPVPRGELEIRMTSFETQPFARLVALLPHLENGWHVIWLRSEQKGVVRHNLFANQMEAVVEAVHHRGLPKRPWDYEGDDIRLASRMIEETNGHAGVFAKGRVADDRNRPIALDFDGEKICCVDARIFRFDIVAAALRREQLEERPCTGARLDHKVVGRIKCSRNRP